MNRDYVTALSIPCVKYLQKPILVYCVAVIVKSILFILQQFTALPAATCCDAGRESVGVGGGGIGVGSEVVIRSCHIVSWFKTEALLTRLKLSK